MTDTKQLAAGERSDAPSGYKVQLALSAWMSARARLLTDDNDLAHDEQALTELLGDETGTVDEILGRVLRAARQAKSMADAAGEMIEDIQARKARYARRNDALRTTAFAILEALDRKKHEMPDMTVTIRAGQPSVVITDEDAIPDIYVRIERKVDRATLLSALKAGHTVEGATLSNGLASLSIRTK
jgi:hypothetical protein